MKFKKLIHIAETTHSDLLHKNSRLLLLSRVTAAYPLHKNSLLLLLSRVTAVYPLHENSRLLLLSSITAAYPLHKKSRLLLLIRITSAYILVHVECVHNVGGFRVLSPDVAFSSHGATRGNTNTGIHFLCPVWLQPRKSWATLERRQLSTH
jgi:hypothetical protein